jgi:hypothetical protein
MRPALHKNLLYSRTMRRTLNMHKNLLYSKTYNTYACMRHMSIYISYYNHNYDAETFVVRKIFY